MRLTRSRPRLGAAAAVVAIAAGLLSWAPGPASAAGFTTEDATITSGTGSDAVQLDTTLFIPDGAANDPAAAIVIAHGYGGTKLESKGQATKLARDGYVVMTYSARGFGDSTGEISMDAPDYEVADARTLIDVLSEREDVLQDGEGDPRVGFFGGSYGGGLALLAAAYDQRVDAVQATRTWNSLTNALFPNNAGEPTGDTPAAAGDVEAQDGVFKKLWGQFFFEGGQVDAEGGSGAEDGAARPSTSDGCGGLRPEYCDAFRASLSGQNLTPEMKNLLDQSSPASVIDQINAPTLLVQGEGDKLFSLSEADANARGIAANGTPVKVMWVSGGHGSNRPAQAEAASLDQVGTAWFDYYLRGQGSAPDLSFQYTEITGQTDRGLPEGGEASVADYPGLTNQAASRVEIPLAGNEQQFVHPADGTPAAYTALPPGFFPESGNRRQVPEEIDGQYAVFDTGTLSEDLAVVGTPAMTVSVASSSGSAILFGKVYDVDENDEQTLVQALVSPVMMDDVAGSIADAQPVTFTLPAMAQTFAAGHKIRVVLATTDQGYATGTDEVTYTAALADGSGLTIPDITGQSTPDIGAPTAPSQDDVASGNGNGGGGGNRLVLIAAGLALVIVLVVGGLLVGRRSRSGS